MPLILDGKIARKYHETKLKNFVSKFAKKPTLTIIQIGDDERSNIYIEQKKKCGLIVDIRVEYVKLNEKVSFEDLKTVITEKNKNELVSGIIIQLPLPAHLEKQKVIDLIDARKDVDGLTSINKDNLEKGKEGAFVPATARGIMSLLSFYNIPVSGKKTAVLGRSDLVGKPVALILEKAGAIVTVCHSKTENTKEIVKGSEIVIVAIGKPNFIDETFTNKEQVIIDVGINTIEGITVEEIAGKKIVGDVDFNKVARHVTAISPVPGGVGPMTVISLFENVFRAECVKLLFRK